MPLLIFIRLIKVLLPLAIINDFPSIHAGFTAFTPLYSDYKLPLTAILGSFSMTPTLFSVIAREEQIKSLNPPAH